jgi:hypothetical protein
MCRAVSRGVAPGWYALPLWGRDHELPFRNSAAFGKRMEFYVVGRMPKQGGEGDSIADF